MGVHLIWAAALFAGWAMTFDATGAGAAAAGLHGRAATSSTAKNKHAAPTSGSLRRFVVGCIAPPLLAGVGRGSTGGDGKLRGRPRFWWLGGGRKAAEQVSPRGYGLETPVVGNCPFGQVSLATPGRSALQEARMSLRRERLSFGPRDRQILVAGTKGGGPNWTRTAGSGGVVGLRNGGEPGLNGGGPRIPRP